jgi:imidazolonepropionase-like amidohydrolase
MTIQRFFVLSILFAGSSMAQQGDSPILFTNVHVFDGVNEQRIENANVLVVDNIVTEVSAEPIAVENARLIDGDGRTLMPGLIDSHVHLMVKDAPHRSIYEKPWSYVGAQAVVSAEAMLLRGFTTVRDIGGPVAGLKGAIDQRLVKGPRVFPSGAFISQTSGHGDFDPTSAKLSPYFTGIPDRAAVFGWAFVADGVPEVQKAAREVLRTGASQIKVMAGGGVSSDFDPLDTTQYTLEELKAIVTEAEHWGTYVAAHAFTDAAVQNCIDAGIKSIEHGPFLSEVTLRRMAKEGVWLSPQAFVFRMTPEDLNIVGTPSEPKMRQVNSGSDDVLRLASELGVKIAFGTDLFGPPEREALQPMEFRARARYFTNVEILRQATFHNAQLLQLSGLRNPYTEGKLGVIEPGAYADIIVVDGNPIDDIELMVDPATNFKLIMKDGVIHKNTL